VRSLIAIGVVVLLWALGLFLFADRVIESTPAAEPDQPADAVVVLTGASDARLREGMRLLDLRKGNRMLISGVNPEVKRSELLKLTEGSKRLYDCCVDLGFQAENTVGNAREIADWARAHDFYNLIVVTSDYHMPRALLEIKADLPEAKLVPYPVATPDLDARTWWKSPKGTKLILIEYDKYLVILARDMILSVSRAFGDHGGKKPAPGTEDSAVSGSSASASAAAH
jgi:uncharacterized SAM-binding protein YcdF (DUF218 family)